MATISPTFPAVGQTAWGAQLNGDLQSMVDLVNRHELTSIGVGASQVVDAIAIGRNANPTFNNAIAIGIGATATTGAAISLGLSANASNGGLALGNSTVASGSNAVAAGNAAQATGNTSTAVGNGAKATAANGTAVGSNTLADLTGGVNTAIAANSIAAGLSQLTEKAWRFTTTSAALRNNQFTTGTTSFTRFSATVLARQLNANVARIWTVGMHIERISGNYRLVGTPTVVDVAQDAGSEAWVVTASAPAGTGPTIGTTGAASTTIEWSIVGRMEELRAAFTSA